MSLSDTASAVEAPDAVAMAEAIALADMDIEAEPAHDAVAATTTLEDALPMTVAPAATPNTATARADALPVTVATPAALIVAFACAAAIPTTVATPAVLKVDPAWPLVALAELAPATWNEAVVMAAPCAPDTALPATPKLAVVAAAPCPKTTACPAELATLAAAPIFDASVFDDC